MKITARVGAFLDRFAAEPVPVETETVEVCGACGHAKDEQEPSDLGHWLGQKIRRARRKPPAPAMCGSHVNPDRTSERVTLAPCQCRAAFHGS